MSNRLFCNYRMWLKNGRRFYHHVPANSFNKMLKDHLATQWLSCKRYSNIVMVTALQQINTYQSRILEVALLSVSPSKKKVIRSITLASAGYGIINAFLTYLVKTGLSTFSVLITSAYGVTGYLSSISRSYYDNCKNWFCALSAFRKRR